MNPTFSVFAKENFKTESYRPLWQKSPTPLLDFKMTFKLTVACFIIASLMAVEAAKMPRTNHKHGIHDGARYRAHFLKDFLYRRSCVALEGTGCEGNNAKCCREGNPYTGKMRKCVNVGSFSGPKYQCKEE
ncbi:uncharacterized protein [Montipora foliosa]|uniref:uncharacterized protein n=2 Tax=Montipora foliosa TaxID=591990 RepID=UPI0035F11B71